jgi:hypothetical protein
MKNLDINQKGAKSTKSAKHIKSLVNRIFSAVFLIAAIFAAALFQGCAGSGGFSNSGTVTPPAVTPNTTLSGYLYDDSIQSPVLYAGLASARQIIVVAEKKQYTVLTDSSGFFKADIQLVNANSTVIIKFQKKDSTLISGEYFIQKDGVYYLNTLIEGGVRLKIAGDKLYPFVKIEHPDNLKIEVKKALDERQKTAASVTRLSGRVVISSAHHNDKSLTTGVINTEETPGSPLQGVDVTLSTGLKAVTDINGYFTIAADLKAGAYSLVLKKAGYPERTINFSVESKDYTVGALDFFAEMESGLKSLQLSKTNENINENTTFNLTSIKTVALYADSTTREVSVSWSAQEGSIINSIYSPPAGKKGIVVLTAKYSEGLKTQTALLSISINALLTGLISGESFRAAEADTPFDLKSVKTTASYSDGTSREVSVSWAADRGSISAFNYIPPAGYIGEVNFLASYTEAQITKTAAFKLKLSRVAKTLTLSKTFDEMSVGAVYKLAEITVSVNYSDKTSRVITPVWSYNGAALDEQRVFLAPASPRSVILTASYSEDGINASAIFDLKIKPLITGLSAYMGVPGEKITVTGLGFGAARGESLIKFNQKYASNLDIESWSDNAIIVKIPAGSTPGPLSVIINQIPAAGVNFDVSHIASITPAAGTAQTMVTIAGSGFGSSQGANKLKFGNINANDIISWSNSKIVARVPQNTPRGDVFVEINGLRTNGVSFGPTSIFSISPVIVKSGDAVTINGAGFGETQGTGGIVIFDGVTASYIKKWSDTIIETIVPQGVKSGYLTVTAGEITSNQYKYDMTSIAAPVPSFGFAGDLIDIQGEGFGNYHSGASVSFNGAPATAIENWTNDIIRVKVPAGAITGKVSVKINNIEYLSGKNFELTSISSINPQYGPAGTAVDIYGSGFGEAQAGRIIKIGAVEIGEILSWTNNIITVKIPATAVSGAVKLISGAAESNAGNIFSVTNITSITPAGGVIGTTVTISGANFGDTQGAGSVKFAAVTASEIISWTASKIIAKVPAGAGAGSVSIITAAGAVHNGFNFEVINISQITPAAGTYGDEITIKGSGFGSSPAPGNIVKIGAATASEIKSWSDKEIKFIVPHNSDSAKASVTVNGITSNGVDFRIIAISSISQDYGPPGMPVTIKGSGFGGSQTANNFVKFSGAGIAETDIISWSDTEIIAKIPLNAAAGAASIKISSNGVESNSAAFEVTHINSVNPVQGTAGTQLIIYGTGFGAARESNNVRFNSATATSIVSWVNDKITVAVPANSVSGSLEVIISGVRSNSKTVSIISINSLSAGRGAANTQISVNGTGFGGTKGANKILINDIEMPVAGGLWTDSMARVTIPETAVSGTIKAVINDFETNSIPFVVMRFAAQTPAAPTYGPPGTLVAINGAGFGASKGSLAFNGVSAALINEWEDNIITATLPEGASSGPITVTSDGSVLSSPHASFKVSKITSITPSYGPIGSLIKLAGEGFGNAQAGNLIKFNGATDSAANIVSWSDNLIEVIVPQGASTGGVKVNIWGSDSLSHEFTVTNISSVIPACGPIGTPVTINGAGFGAPAGVVKFNTATAIVAPGDWSDTSIVTTVPDAAVSGTVSVSVFGILNTWAGFKITKISAIDREFGPAGMKVTVSGEGFGAARGSNGVYFNALPAAAADYFLWSDNSIIVKVPAGASSGNIKVKIGDLYSNDFNFKVSTITSLLPDYGPAGSVIDINGTAFGAAQGTGRVLYGGVSLASSDIYSWSDTKIRVKVPNGSVSNAFTVEVNGTATNEYNFHITQIDSTNKPKVTAGEVLIIYGTGFGPVKGSAKVLFDALNSTPVEAVINSWSMNAVEVIVPYGAVSGNLRFEINGLISQLYAYQALTVSSLTPFAGTAGQEVTITGSGFGSSRAAGDIVRFGGTPVETTDYINWSDSQIRVKVPPTADSGGVTVTAGGIVSNGYLFNIIKVSSIIPNPLNTGVDVTVTGSGFGITPSAVSVKFNDITATGLSDLTNTSFKIKVPLHAVNGSLRVIVNGVMSNEMPYKILKITAVTPSFAKRGDEITITGEGFGTTQGANKVKIGTFDLAVAGGGWSDTSIKGNIAAGTLPGDLRVIINNAESNKVWFEIDLNYNYNLQFGSFGTGDSQFNTAEDIALDGAGNIWVADTNNYRVQKYNSVGGLLGWIGRDDTGGSGWHAAASGNTSVSGAGNSEFDTVTGVAVDSANNLYVVDSGNKKIKKFNSDGGYIKTFETGTLNNTTYSQPSKIAVNSDSKVYVSDSVTNKILRFTSEGVFEAEFGGAGNGIGQFNGVSGIAVSADKKIFAADTNNHRVQVFDSNGVFITSWGGYGTGNGQFNAPAGIAVDGASNVYVADTFNNRIQKFTAAGVYIFSSGASGTGNGQFNRPSGAAVIITPNTSADTIFVADKNNNRIQKFVREN